MKAWAIKWIDPTRSHLLTRDGQPILYSTRKQARGVIRQDYPKTYPTPRAVKVKITISEI